MGSPIVFLIKSFKEKFGKENIARRERVPSTPARWTPDKGRSRYSREGDQGSGCLEDTVSWPPEHSSKAGPGTFPSPLLFSSGSRGRLRLPGTPGSRAERKSPGPYKGPPSETAAKAMGVRVTPPALFTEGAPGEGPV